MPALEGQLPAGDLGQPHPADGERHHRPRVRLDHQQPRAPGAGLVHDHALRHRQPLGRRRSRRTSSTLADLKGKTIVSTAGTTNIKQITEINAAQNLGMNIISANGHPEAFQMVETGRAVAFVMDDILLASLAAQSRNPGDYAISAEATVGRALRHHGAQGRHGLQGGRRQARCPRSTTSGQINAIYEKWFQKPVPPEGHQPATCR